MDDSREPILIAAGDTISWQRYLPKYLPSAGWYILGEIRSADQPTNPAIQFQSTPDSTQTVHKIAIAAATSAGWLPGENVLVEYIKNDSLNERHQIYQNNLVIRPNLGTPTNQASVKTFAQQQIEELQTTLSALNKHSLIETDIQKVHLIREKRKDIRVELAYWEDKRRNEIALENVAAGRPSGQKITPIFRIIDNGCSGSGSQNPFFPNS